MGLFLKIEDKGEYLQIRRRKYTMYLVIALPVFYFIIGPILCFTFGVDKIYLFVGPIYIALPFIGLIMGIEGMYYLSMLPKKYKKEGKKVVKETSGPIINKIKLYK